MKLIFDTFSNDKDVAKLVKWIKGKVDEGNHDILYVIGSELKK